MASFDLMTKKQIANVGPFSSARQMNEPFSDLRYAGLSHYFDQIRAGIKFINQKSGETKICSMYIPSDFGIEIMEGAKAVAKELNLAYLAETGSSGREGASAIALHNGKTNGLGSSGFYSSSDESDSDSDSDSSSYTGSDDSDDSDESDDESDDDSDDSSDESDEADSSDESDSD